MKKEYACYLFDVVPGLHNRYVEFFFKDAHKFPTEGIRKKYVTYEVNILKDRVNYNVPSNK